MVRQPVVAGMFYESTAGRLRAEIQQLMPSAPVSTRQALGVMVPHAGYIYSGHTAAAVYARLCPADVYVLLGPNHTGHGKAVAISAAEAWQTPLGQVQVEQSMVRTILNINSEVQLDELAHLQEHSLEVQLPFLQMPGRPITIIPIVLGTQRIQTLEALGKSLAQCLQASNKKCLIIASSDMNHFESLERTRQLDESALQHVLERDPIGLLETVRKKNISMCGAGPTAVMLFAAREMGAQEAELVEYTTSADFSGDKDRVVGYAGVIVG